MEKISIIILNWNRPKDTIECIESLKNIIVNSFLLEIIVVDNASDDDSYNFIKKSLAGLKKEKKWKVELICNENNLGFAEGNNVGIRHALNHGSDLVLILNNDTLVDSKLIDGLLKARDIYPKAGIIAPKIYFAKGYEFHKNLYKKKDLGRVIWYAGGNLDWNNIYGTNRGVDEVDKSQYDKLVQTDFSTGSCMLVKREVLEKVGLFDPKYYLYLEDVDFCQRVKKFGWEIVYSPFSHIWHKVSQSSGIGSNLNDYFISRNRLLFGMKYASFRTRFALYRESLRLLLNGRDWQRKGVIDFYFGKFGKGSWK